MTCLANNLTPTNINITKENMKFPDNASCLHWKRIKAQLIDAKSCKGKQLTQ